MPKSPNDYPTNETSVVDKLAPAYDLENSPDIGNRGAYTKFLPDYVAKNYRGIARFFRWTGAPQWERLNPDELQVLKAAIVNPVGNVYTATPTGRQVSISALAANPYARWRMANPTTAEPEAPQINQGGLNAYLELANSIVRRR